MSDFITWRMRLTKEVYADKEITDELHSEYFQKKKEFPAEKFIDHHLTQAIKADDELKSEKGHLWEVTREYTKELKEALESNNQDLALISAYQLGVTAGQLINHIDSADRIAGLEARIADYERQKGLSKINTNRAKLKGIAQNIAKEYWKQDKEQKLRLSEACEKTWNSLCEISKDTESWSHMPDRASGLKPWLREVAPDYAKKGGRPKSK